MDDFERPKTIVQWMLGNRCNYNCSYCLDLLKRGDFNPPDEEIFIETCKDIIYHYDDLGRDVVFEFIGGEPTLMEKIPEIGQRLHNYPTNIILRTNGSASLDWWKNSYRYLSEVTISVHREFADVKHIEDVIEFLQNVDISSVKLSVLFPVTVRPESWEWGIRNFKKFKKRYGVGELQLLYSNFGRGNNKLLPYKKEQWDEYYKLTGKERIIIEEPVISTIPGPPFNGRICDAGLDILVIDAKGDVFRGWCLQGGKLGNINDKVNWPTDTVFCKKPDCTNKFDLNAKRVNL